MMNFRVFLLVYAVLSLAGCGDETSSGRSGRNAQVPLVEVAAVAQEDVIVAVTRLGHLRSEESFKVINQEEGVIVALPPHPGDRVEAGDVLLQLDERMLRTELQRASALRRQAEQDLQRMVRLEGQRAVSDDELARSRTALEVARAEESLLQLRLERTRVLAPFAGVVTERLAEPGDALARHQHVLTLSGTGNLLVDVDVAAPAVARLETGDVARVNIDALGLEGLAGRILRIHPAIETSTGQGRLEIVLDERVPGLMPGQLAQVELDIKWPAQLTVPYSALREDEQGSYLWIVDAGEQVRRVPVRVLRQYGTRVSLQGALEPDMRVVTRGFSGIGAGIVVTVVMVPSEP